jgi:PhoH-like ATPase
MEMHKVNKKTYILDTNVLLSDPTSIFAFEENDVIIPLIVLEELDHHKSRQDEVGKNARTVSRSLDDLRKKGSLFEGVRLNQRGATGLLKVDTADARCAAELPLELRSDVGRPTVDNMIIAFMLQFAKRDDENVITLVSKDINVRLKCDALHIRCEDYLKMRVTDDTKKFYTGVDVIEMPYEDVEKFYRESQLTLSDDLKRQHKLFPNQIVIIKNSCEGKTTKSAIAKCIDPEKPLVPIANIEQAFRLKPRNKEQKFSLDLLFDENVKLLTLTGTAGCGKTCLALAAALEQLKGLGSVPRYDKLIVSRPIQPLGNDIGYLPGTLEEKMEPWIAPIRDNINFLVGCQKTNKDDQLHHRRRVMKSGESREFVRDDYISLMQEKGLIEIEAITYIRGRSIPNAFIIIDEAQNLSMHELKTIITRVGENTKIILTGDLEQIDNVHVDAYSCGLSYAVERFKDYPIAGHVMLLKGERSALADLASKIL